MSEDQGFEVRDRRRVRADEESPTASASAEAGEASAAAESPEERFDAGEEAMGAGPEGGMPPFELTVSGVLMMTVGLLNEKAWVSMGLVPDPVTGRMDRNLEEARRAIDVVTDLVKHLEPDTSPEEKRELQSMLSTLRLNFVRQSQQPRE